MLDIAIAPSVDDCEGKTFPVRLSLGGPVYWFLHRYFVHACLSPGSFEFLNQYEDTEISGYQLIRLRQELIEALSDLSARPESFRVLTGWKTSEVKEETEDWRQIDRDEVQQTVKHLIALIDESRTRGMCIVAIGD